MNKLNTQSGLLRTSTLAIALCAFAPAGCGNDDLVDARPVVSRVGQALFLSGDVQLLKGKYYSCRTHVDGTAWSIANGVSAQGDQVQVVKRNTACQLKIDSMVIDRGGTLTTFSATSAFVMGADYQSEAMLFSAGSEKFYSNLKISDTTYADAFDVSMLFASDPVAVSESAAASFAKSTTDQISVDGVPVPDYVFENDGLTIPIRDDYTLDGNASGGINLNHAMVQGDQYILTQSNPGSTADAINSFWVTNAASAVSIDVDADLAFAAVADLGLTADSSLSSPKVWYVLIANADESSSGTRSYQKFTITISHP